MAKKKAPVKSKKSKVKAKPKAKAKSKKPAQKKEKSVQLYQQGDCLLKTGPVPKGAEPTGPDLIKSAVTGHAHRVTGSAQVFKVGEKLFVRAPEAFDLVHEEHKTLTIPAGEYFMDNVQEYDHLAEEARAVAD